MLNLSDIREYVELTQGLLAKQADQVDRLSRDLAMAKTAAQPRQDVVPEAKVNRWGSSVPPVKKASSDKEPESERFIRRHFRV
jgi:hypothetical protein